MSDTLALDHITYGAPELDVDLVVARTPEPGLRATLEGPAGRVELR